MSSFIFHAVIALYWKRTCHEGCLLTAQACLSGHGGKKGWRTFNWMSRLCQTRRGTERLDQPGWFKNAPRGCFFFSIQRICDLSFKRAAWTWMMDPEHIVDLVKACRTFCRVIKGTRSATGLDSGRTSAGVPQMLDASAVPAGPKKKKKKFI